MQFNRKGLDDATLLALYKAIVKPRRIEEKMLKLLRQGKVSKWFAGIGQEAIAVGVASALREDEWLLPMHRNLGVFTSRNVPLERLFMQFQGKEGGFTKGRDRSFHFGSFQYHISGMISHLGPQPTIANGIALAHLLNKENKIAAVFNGDGGTSQGDFHEALNVASVWQLPVIFIIENNGYGLSTPISEQYNCNSLVERAKGYGMKGVKIDGNNVLDVFRTISDLAIKMREKPEPVLVECMTFRMRGHEEASGTKYVPDELFDFWAQKDPVSNYERFLKEEGVLKNSKAEAILADIDEEMNTALRRAFERPDVDADTLTELNDVYQPHEPKVLAANTKKQTKKRFVDAVSEGLADAMEQYDNLIIMGQDVADYGGVFKVTDGFTERFGKDRVRNTPLCESAIIGAGMGLSLEHMKSVIEMQFADFVSTGFNQIVNNLAKKYYRWGANADVVIRMPTGAGVGAGPFHSQSNEAWFYHTPGLKIVYPATPYDAKGLMLSAVDDPNPVMFFEHKFMYRTQQQEIPDEAYTVPIGKARLAREGEDISVITYGMGVHWAHEVLDQHPDISADVLDLRTLMPLDLDAIHKTVKKTGKVIVLHEDTLTGGIGADIAATITEHLFEHLDGPVIRVGALDTPVPFAAPLEKQFLPRDRFEKQLLKLAAY